MHQLYNDIKSMPGHNNQIFYFSSFFTDAPIGVGRFRILGGPRFRILGGPRGAKFPAGTCRRKDVDAT